MSSGLACVCVRVCLVLASARRINIRARKNHASGSHEVRSKTGQCWGRRIYSPGKTMNGNRIDGGPPYATAFTPLKRGVELIYISCLRWQLAPRSGESTSFLSGIRPKPCNHTSFWFSSSLVVWISSFHSRSLRRSTERESFSKRQWATFPLEFIYLQKNRSI